jgi:hypothetical protein
LGLEFLQQQSSWGGVHVYGQYDWNQLLSPFCIWVHLDAFHALNNALLGIWVLLQIQHKLGFLKGLALGFAIAIDLSLFEELVHLWSPLPPAQGASGWLYAHLPLCIYWSIQHKWWKKWTWSTFFIYFVFIEDVIYKLVVRDFFNTSSYFHLLGFILGLGWLWVVRVWARNPVRDS